MLPILATTDEKDSTPGSAAWSGRSAYSNSSGNSTLSPYSPSRPEWDQTGGLFSFANEVVSISSDKSSLASDLDSNLFALNQLFLYTKGNIKELGNIIVISTEGKGARPLYKINIKGVRNYKWGLCIYPNRQE